MEEGGIRHRFLPRGEETAWHGQLGRGAWARGSVLARSGVGARRPGGCAVLCVG
jgi:hypothetical protein